MFSKTQPTSLYLCTLRHHPKHRTHGPRVARMERSGMNSEFPTHCLRFRPTGRPVLSFLPASLPFPSPISTPSAPVPAQASPSTPAPAPAPCLVSQALVYSPKAKGGSFNIHHAPLPSLLKTLPRLPTEKAQAPPDAPSPSQAGLISRKTLRLPKTELEGPGESSLHFTGEQPNRWGK